MATNSIVDIMPLWVFNLIVSAIVLLSLEGGGAWETTGASGAKTRNRQ